MICGDLAPKPATQTARLGTSITCRRAGTIWVGRRGLGSFCQRSSRRRTDGSCGNQARALDSDGTEGDGDGKQHARHDGLASSPPAATGASVKTVEMPPPGSKTVTIIDGSSGARKEFTIPRSAEGNQQKKPDRSETDRGDQSRAPFRRLDLTVRARRPATRTRASFPKIRKIPPSLPLSSAASASALQAPPMRLPSFQQP